MPEILLGRRRRRKDTEGFILADNGVTVVYTGQTAGAQGYINNDPITYPTLYTAVDDTLLLTYDPATDDFTSLCTTLVTSLSRRFREQPNFNQNISHFDTSNVTNLFQCFFNTGSFNQDISNWDVSNVTTLRGCFAASVFNQPLNNWDVGNVQSFQSCFQDSIYNHPLNGWNVSNGLDLFRMFYLNEDFNQPLSNWDVSNAQDMRTMFAAATTFNQDLSPWCVSQFATEPSNFSVITPSWTLPKPNWGAPC